MMKAAKLSIDLSDRPQLAELLRTYAAQTGRTQKAVLVEALTGYFADRQETRLLLAAADRAFAEWDNPDDAVYDTL